MNEYRSLRCNSLLEEMDSSASYWSATFNDVPPYALASCLFLGQIASELLQSFAQRSSIADGLIYGLASNNLLKGGVLITVFWWACFRKSADNREPGNQDPREILLYTLLICIPAVLFARYPSDILVGSLLGVAAVSTVQIAPLRRVVGGGRYVS